MLGLNNYSLNLDISDYSLKAGRLVKKRRDVYVDKFAHVSVPPGYIERGRIKKSAEVAALVKDLLRQVQPGWRRNNIINTVLPETDTFVKLIEVEPAKTADELNNKINQEIAHHIPYAPDEVYLDWQKITVDKPNKMQQVLVGVCPKEIVDEYAKMLHQAGCIVRSFEIEALAITRAIFNINRAAKKSLSNRNIMVIDLGAARSGLIFWREQSLNLDLVEFSVSLPISGCQIDDLIEHQLQLTADQAKKFKLKCGLLEEQSCQGVLLKLLQPILDDLIKRIRHAIYFHNTYFEGATINSVILCGGGANLRGMAEYLAKNLDIAVAVADPTINIKNKDFASPAQAMSYCTLIGLGLRDFF